MHLAFGRSASSTSLLVLLAVTTLVRSQAPNDASCDKGDTPDGVFMLLDMYWYRTLLSGGTSSPAGWTQTPENSWTGQGNICARSLKSCDSSTTGWLVTQYISKSADVSYPLEITVDINGNTGSCSGCTSNAIEAYFYPSNGAIASGAQLNSNNYNVIGSITFSSTAATKSVTFSLGSEYDRFYIAIVAESVCFTLRRLRVSYSVCPENTEGLVVYPNTPIGSSPETTTASCKANAEGDPSSSLVITCNTDGSYTYDSTPSCSCKGGYFLSGSSCFACAAGKYSEPGGSCMDCWSNSDSMAAAETCYCIADYYLASAKTCNPCPSQSTSQPGEDICTCVASYYRGTEDDPFGPCTTGPGAPSGLKNTSVSDTSVSLSWTAPTSNGGRTDSVYYTIRYKIDGGSFEDYNPSSTITSTSATVSGLLPVTEYMFEVVAENKVTIEFPGGFSQASSRTSNEITITTKASPPKAPYCSVVGGTTLVWHVTPAIAGEITEYDIMIGVPGKGESQTEVNASTRYFVPSPKDFEGAENKSITLKVRGINSGGDGEWCSGANISYCVFQNLLTAGSDCSVTVISCPTNPSEPGSSSPTLSSNSTSDPSTIILDNYVLYSVAAGVGAVFLGLIIMLVVLCCFMKFRKKDVFLTKTINGKDEELVSFEKPI